MRSDVGSTLGAFADDGADLILTILVHPDRVGGRGDAARSHDLDTMRPSAELLACCLETFIDTVRDHGDGVEVAARAVAVIVPALAHLAQIAVAACHRQDFARIEEPRRPKQPVLDCAPQAPVATAAISYCREARSEEHTSELQSLMRISYAVFCLKKKINNQSTNKQVIITKIQLNYKE